VASVGRCPGRCGHVLHEIIASSVTMPLTWGAVGPTLWSNDSCDDGDLRGEMGA
jgi:hypothetical protein